MDKDVEVLIKLKDDIINRINGQVFHSAAVDMRILALTSLFLEKGLITEEEVQKSYAGALDSVKRNDDFKGEGMSGFEEYLKDFLSLV